MRIHQLYSEESDPGLDNSCLGCVAACFMDSLITLNLPAWGYGLFRLRREPVQDSQLCLNYWAQLLVQNPIHTPVAFYGHVDKCVWKPGLSIIAFANDFLIPDNILSSTRISFAAATTTTLYLRSSGARILLLLCALTITTLLRTKRCSLCRST